MVGRRCSKPLGENHSNPAINPPTHSRSGSLLTLVAFSSLSATLLFGGENTDDGVDVAGDIR